MVCHYTFYGSYPLTDWLQVIWHSIPQHMTVAGYIMALPLLLELVLLFFTKRPRWSVRFLSWYMAFMSGVLVLGWMVNVVLYGYWGIVLDSTALIYLQDNPADAMAESPWWALLLVPTLFALTIWIVRRGVQQLYGSRNKFRLSRTLRSLLVLLFCVFDFLAIRGGWTASTMNPGRAYFSSEMVLNHAAVDPVFNFLYSLGKNNRFDRQYRFMSDAEAVEALDELNHTVAISDTIDSLAVNTVLDTSHQRPNILLLLLESFSGSACHYLTPDADAEWMPNLNQAMAEGLAFTRFYANSFRTDRGVAAVLASYPGQPTNSVMKDQSKCDNLQYLSKRLGEAGYRLQFIHGGDVNFTNMQGFLRAGGITNIVGDTDFPMSERLDKWGVRDDRMFDYVAQEVITDALAANVDVSGSEGSHQPFFKVFLSLSSHEPFEVPYHHYSDPYINSVAYADSCLGVLLSTLKSRPEVWDNLLVIGLPDHCYAKFPATILQHDPQRYHIPMFWTGGAIHEHRDVDVIGQQTDLSATLLGQLFIPHDDFLFSKDMFDASIGHYAFYAFSDGFGLITDSCSYVQDNNSNGVGLQPGTDDPDGAAERWGKAYLQKLYDDLEQR